LKRQLSLPVSTISQCDASDGWWDVKRATFGGDDGVEEIELETLARWIAANTGQTDLPLSFTAENCSSAPHRACFRVMATSSASRKRRSGRSVERPGKGRRAPFRRLTPMKAEAMQSTLNEDQFAEQYPLIKNPLDKNAAWDGHLFETYGAELAFVRKQNLACIWTIMDDDDGNLCVSSGYHFVNRVGYLISTKPVPEGDDIFVELEQMNDDSPLRLLVCGACLIHGDATGADTLAKEWSLMRNIKTGAYPAEWDDLSHPDAIIRARRDGKRYEAKAGSRRNQRMLDDGKPTLVAAFPGGRATVDMVRRARKDGLHVITAANTHESKI